MADIVRKTYPVIPASAWSKHGSWRKTLDYELAHFKSMPSTMVLMCELWHWPVFVPKLPKIETPTPLSSYPGYTYHWEMTDEHVLNELIITGKFDKDIILSIMSEIERTGVNFENTWDMIIEFH